MSDPLVLVSKKGASEVWVRTCRISLEDGYCGQPARFRTGHGLPVCDDCREWLLHNDWPYGIGRVE